MNKSSTGAVRSIFACCMATFWAGAIAFAYPGIMSTYWQELFQVGSGETGLIVTIMLLGISLCTFFSGKFLNRFGMRMCMLVGTGLMLLGMVILMNARNIYMVYLWAFIVDIGNSFVYGPGLTTAQNWLPHRKGLASGLLNLTFGLSAAIISPVWEAILNTFGYSAVNISLIVCIIVTNIIAMLLVQPPESVRTAASEHLSTPERIVPDLTAGQAVRTRSFWLIWLTWAFVGAAGISMISLSKSYALYLGLSGVVVLTAFNVTNGVGRLIAGSLCDVIGGERTAILGFIIGAVGYLFLPYIHSLIGVAFLVACIGYGFGSLFATTGPIAAKHFGMRYFSTIFGLIFTGYGCVGGIIGPLLAGVVLEQLNNPYPVVFGYLAAFLLIGAVLTFTLKRTCPPVSQRSAN